MTDHATSAAHLRKRKNQPSIDSFFQRNGQTSDAANSPSYQTSPLSPALPVETQSSLLSVGMRVRKSVPEGYRTHKTMPAEEYPFPSTAPATAAPTRPVYNSTSSSRELVPFCGLPKSEASHYKTLSPPLLRQHYPSSQPGTRVTTPCPA
jgi:hypothetical protein